MYNVLEKLRSGEPLTAKERTIHEQGLVSVLRQLHDEIDAAVLDAYGWSDLLPLLRVAHGNDDAPAARGSGFSRDAPDLVPQRKSIAAEAAPTTAVPTATDRDEAKRAIDEAILERLVALNAERAAEETRGQVRWLRPEFQHPSEPAAPLQTELPDDGQTTDAVPVSAAKAQAWPQDSVAQVRAVADVLVASPAPLSLEEIAARFSGRGPWKKRLPQLLQMLEALGRAQRQYERYRATR